MDFMARKSLAHVMRIMLCRASAPELGDVEKKSGRLIGAAAFVHKQAPHQDDRGDDGGLHSRAMGA
jgi:hypothetical protein